ncbi:MAG: hypothetical protein ABIP51_17150 [Bacteroidia bacterium]
MEAFHQQLKKPFHIFSLWLLNSKDLGIGTKLIFSDTYVKLWFNFYNKIFENKEKVLKISKEENLGYTTFMAFYIYYLVMSKPEIKVVVIEKKRSIIPLLTLIDVIMFDRFNIKSLEGSRVFGGTKLTFENESIVKTFPPATYNLKNMGEIEFIFFDECEIKNLEKLNFDISIALETSEIKKMVLTVTNDLSADYPEIKTIKIN